MKLLKKLIKLIKKEKDYDDSLLRKYRFEKDFDYNDGWTKLHYKNLYEKRLKELEDNEKRNPS